MSDTKKVMTVGGATQDIFIRYQDPEIMNLQTTDNKRSFLLLEEGQKIEVQNLAYHTGGGATNAAVSFKRLGFEVASVVKVGSDKASEFIIQRLEQEGIDSRYITQDADTSTGTSFIIPSPSGNRVILAYRGANAQLSLHEIPLSSLANYQQIYITSLTGASSKVLLSLVEQAKQQHVRSAVNPGAGQLVGGARPLQDALNYIDILLFNAREACMFMRSLVQTTDRLKKFLYAQTPSTNIHYPTGPMLLQRPLEYKDISFMLQDFFKEVLSRGPFIVVVTNGQEGVYVATHEKIYFHHSMPVKVVSAIGAGDAFGSCFVASLLHGSSLPFALVHGIINSSSVIGHVGAKTGLLDWQSLLERFNNIGVSGVQEFSW